MACADVPLRNWSLTHSLVVTKGYNTSVVVAIMLSYFVMLIVAVLFRCFGGGGLDE